MQFRNNAIMQFALRAVLGGVLIYAGVLKMLDPLAFADSIYGFQIVPRELISLVALSLPPFEILLGLALILGGFFVSHRVTEAQSTTEKRMRRSRLCETLCLCDSVPLCETIFSVLFLNAIAAAREGRLRIAHALARSGKCEDVCNSANSPPVRRLKARRYFLPSRSFPIS